MTNATFSVYYDTAGSDANPGASTDITALGPPTLKFKLADNTTINTANPIVVPAVASTVYSYYKFIFLKCTANASTHTINNVKIYSDGTNSLGTGVDLMVGLQFPTKNSGATTGYELADNANEMVAETALTTSASIFNYASGTGLTVTISEAGSVINAANETTNYVVLQMNVDNTASPGPTTTETLTFAYDEA